MLIYNDKQWQAFVDAVKPAWAGDQYATMAGRAADIDTVYGLVGDTLRERTTADWLALFDKLGIPASPVRTTDELFTDAHLEAVGFFETVQTEYGPVQFPGVPTGFSRTPGMVRGGAPRLGEHTAEVLAEVGIAPPDQATALTVE